MNNDRNDSITNLTLRTVSTDTTLLTTNSETLTSSSSPSKQTNEISIINNNNNESVFIDSNSKSKDNIHKKMEETAMFVTSFDDAGNIEKNPDENYEESSLLNKLPICSQSVKQINEATVNSNPNKTLSNKCSIAGMIEKNKILRRFLERFEDIRCFTFFMCLIVMLTNALTVGYRNSVITTIEKRFEFSSVFSGVLSGCLEIGSLITTLLVSYLCAKSHIPRCIAISSLFCAIGSLMYSVPHLLSGSYTVNNRVMNMSTNDLICKSSASSAIRKNISLNYPRDLSIQSDSKFSSHHQDSSPTDVLATILSPFDLSASCLLKPSNWGYFTILIISNLLIGSSSAPLYTLGTTYIDNHVPKDSSSVFLAFIYSMLAFGPLVGYLAGAGFLQVYVDGLSYNSQDLNISPGDSQWVGAWYAGFVLFGFLIFLTSFPFFFFPKVINKNRKQVEIEEKFTIPSNCAQSNSNLKNFDENSFGDIKTLPKAIKNLLGNKIFMIVTLAFCFEITIISGFMTFLPKYIEHQFSLNNSVANIYTGGVAIPGACVGIVLGGYLVKRFKIDPRGAALMAITCNIICLVGIVVLIFLGCPNIRMAGTTVSYISNEKIAMNLKKIEVGEFNLTSDCNRDCQCSASSIEPICGSNGITYFSPCHAGCKNFKLDKEGNDLAGTQKKHFYSSCSCIVQDLINNTSPANKENVLPGIDAQTGLCSFNCGVMTPFLIILFFITLLTALNQMPMLMVTLRSVNDIERPFALGLQLVIMRLLAYIPSPLIFGQAIDWTCLVWRKDECDQIGSCLFYNREKFRHVYGSIAAVYKGVSLILFLFLYIGVRKYNFKQKPLEIETVIKGSLLSLNNHNKNRNDNKSNDLSCS